MSTYLSICAIYRDEAPYLREWIEFHRLVGVERFFLYDNLSEDDHLEVLAPYMEDGTVTVQRWPVFDPQVPAYNDCLRWHRYDSRWIAFIDVDEFLFSPTGQPLPELLADYEAWPGVAVAWVMFGTGGHRTRPPGLVIENYLRTIEQPDPIMNLKSVVDPTRVTHYVSGHHCAYSYMSAVDENQFPVNGHTLVPPSFERLRLNHYHCKSEEEFVAKFERWRAIGRRRRIPTAEDLDRVRRNEEEKGVNDETILRFLPALRAALGR
jgi:Glycosyltransferase family 92